MSPRLAHLLTRLYPHAWRERYGEEFANLLQTGRGGLRTAANVLYAAARERILPTQGEPLAHSDSRFQSFCTRAPWAVFTLGPLLLLLAGYFAACCLLWSGWHLFRPDADSPFGGAPFHRIYAIANIYFQANRLFYFSVPLLVGWTITVTAARQRARIFWPSVGLLLISMFGASAEIQASRAMLLHTLGHIRMTFFPVAPQIPGAIVHATAIYILAILPYLVWRFSTRQSRVA